MSSVCWHAFYRSRGFYLPKKRVRICADSSAYFTEFDHVEAALPEFNLGNEGLWPSEPGSEILLGNAGSPSRRDQQVKQAPIPDGVG